jgi:arabinofuranosyltransferase
VAVWTIGGLEQPLVAALLAAALLLARPLAEGTRRDGWLAGIPLALLCWTRPDAPLLVASLAAAIVLARGKDGLRPALTLSLPPAAAVLAQTAFRLLYYGDWLPNPARVKVGLTAARALGGLHYVGDGATFLAGLLALAALAIPAALLDRAVRPRILLLAVPLFAWTAYVALVGGDIFPARRQLIPVVVLAAVLAGEAVCAVLSRSRIAAGVALAAAVASLLWWAPRDPTFAAARFERWEWDGQKVGSMLARAFGPQQPLVAIDAAGTLPYFSDLPSVDMLGLNDRYLALHPPPGFGQGYIGHELGDGRYVLSREPDLVIPCIATGSLRGCFRSGTELIGLPAFRQGWVPVIFETPAPPLRSTIWARREGGRIGIVHSPGTIEVPGYLLAATIPATLDEQGRLGTSVRAEPGRLDGIEVPAGSRVLTAEATGPLTATVSGPGGFSASGPLPLTFHAPGTPLRIEIRAAGAGPAHVRALHIAEPSA